MNMKMGIRKSTHFFFAKSEKSVIICVKCIIHFLLYSHIFAAEDNIKLYCSLMSLS